MYIFVLHTVCGVEQANVCWFRLHGALCAQRTLRHTSTHKQREREEKYIQLRAHRKGSGLN